MLDLSYGSCTSRPRPSAVVTRSPLCLQLVRENLMFACKMYSPSMSHADCNKRVDTVLASLGLEGCQHTKVSMGVVVKFAARLTCKNMSTMGQSTA